MPHLTTPDEINRINMLLGFGIRPMITIPPEDFINSEFSGIELHDFIRAVMTILMPMTSMPLNKFIALDGTWEPEMTISCISEDYRDMINGLLFQRTFVKTSSGLKVKHDYLVLPYKFRHKGHAKRILGICLQQYVHMNVKIIYVHAGFQNGGYAWARAGFKAIDRKQVNKILVNAARVLIPDEYIVVKAIYDGYFNDFANGPDYREFPIEAWARLTFGKKFLDGSDWEGEIDLTNIIEFTKFNNYVNG